MHKVISFLIVSFLIFLTACSQASQTAALIPTPAIFTETSPAAEALPTLTQGQAIPTPIQPTPTIQTPDITPLPTPEPLIREDLLDITLANIHKLETIGQIPYPKFQPDHNIYFMQFSHNTSKLVIISENWDTREKLLVVWDLLSNKQIFEIANPAYPLSWAAFSLHSQQLWVLRENYLDQYDLDQGLLLDSIALPEHSQGAMALSPCAQYLATASYDSLKDLSRVQLTRLGEEAIIFSHEIPYMISTLNFSPDGKWLIATSSRIGAIITRVWDHETGELIKELNGYDCAPLLSSDAALAALVKDSKLSIFSTDHWELVSLLDLEVNANMMPKFFTSDDQVLAMSDTYNALFVDLSTGKTTLELPGNIALIKLSPNNKIILTTWNLKEIKLWGILE